MLTTDSDYKGLSARSDRFTTFQDNGQKISLKNVKQGKMQSRHFRKRKRNTQMTVNFDHFHFQKQNQQKFSFTNFLCIARKQCKQSCPCFSGQSCPWAVKWLRSNHLHFHCNIAQVEKKTNNQITKDIDRTQNLYPIQKKQQLASILSQSLLAYSCIDTEVGYVQGFNEIMGAIVSHTYNSDKALTIFYFLMNKRHFRNLYLDDFSQAKIFAKKMIKTIKKKCHSLYQHLCISLCVDLEPFILGWIIPLFSNIVGAISMHLVIDGLIRGGFAFLYAFTIALFVHLKDDLLEIMDTQDLMVELSVYSLRNKNLDWSSIINFATKLPLIQQWTGIFC